MANLFDALVDVALGLTAPVAPVTTPMFARDAMPIMPLELEVAPARVAPHRATESVTAEPRERTITVERSEHAPTRPTDPGHVSTRSSVAQALAPLAPLVAPTPARPAPPPADRTDRTAPLAVPDVPAASRSRFSVSVGGATLVVAGAEPEATRTTVATPTASRRSSNANQASPLQARDSETTARTSAESVIRVSIGRVDVRAIHPREPAPRAREAAPSRASGSLSDFLRDRSRSR